MNLRDKWCLITGASSGIGAEFARQLAGRGASLILVARREERLDELARQLQETHGTQTRVLAVDLTQPDAVDRITAAVSDLEVDLLINNAGFGHYGAFADMDPARIHNLLTLNILSLTAMTRCFVGPMIARRRGGIINVASTAAFQPLPWMSLYAASKAFVLHFSEGLWAETKKKGVVVQALCPGFTKTEFFDQAKMPTTVPFGTTTVEYVVERSLQALERKKQFVIPGWKNLLVAWSNRFVSRKTAAKIGGRMMHPSSHRTDETAGSKS